MSRYVDKPHGLTIGSGNIFFVIDRHAPEGVADLRDGYTAIVSIRKYQFDRCSTANVFIETPAEQLIWQRKVVKVPQTMGNLTYHLDRNYWTLTPLAQRWLEENVGKLHQQWDTYTQAEMSGRCVFFNRRKDALAFCKMIDGHLSGVKIGEW